MSNTFIKAEKVAAQSLAVLARDVVLPGLVTRESGSDFTGAKNDTVTTRVPAYVEARSRVMRSGTTITVDDLDETSVDVKLDTHVYKAVGITDEEMTLDIANFGEQVSAPVMGSVVRKVEAVLATAMDGATYSTVLNINESDPYATIIKARTALNKVGVPTSDRFLAVGADVEEYLLLSNRISNVDTSGSDAALREAVIGRIGGFLAVSVPGLQPDTFIAAHKSAFVLASQAPVIPDGAGWGASASAGGFALRTLKDYDMTNVRDRYLADVFIGAGVVKDRGTLDGNGVFTPSEDGTAPPILVRAVKATLSGS